MSKFFRAARADETYVRTCPLHTNSGSRKREAHINWCMVPEKAAPVTGTALSTTGPLLADSQQ